MRQCSRCASELSSNDKVCPRCGLPVDKMGEAEDALAEEMLKQSKSENLNKAQKKEKKRLAKLAKKEAKRKRKEAAKVSTTDFSKFAANSTDSDEVVVKSKKKRKKNDQFQFEVDENGEFNIDTKDVEIIGEEASKIYEERRKQQEYSIKKARGDYRPPRVKWWEIYKLADRAFARRKIKKDVTKAAKIRPDTVSKTKLLLLSIFLGWCGVHNFYAKNKKKGFVSLTFLLISVISMMLNSVNNITVQLWLIGFPGFIVISIWVIDIVNIIFNKFEYRIQKEKFISGMNIETRAKLGEKYIDLELLKKPWWVRFKVWLDKKKKNYHEWKHERRQAMIAKEKAKLENQEEKEKIAEEVAEFEKKELEKIENEKKKDKPVTSYKKAKKENTEVEATEEVQEKKVSAPKKAKISVKTNKTKKK
ncbi:MAG: hypothetical protein IKJ33_01375 [Clostridia bacterium]|nr:hypothetical protein [Clostridia bacterium]